MTTLATFTDPTLTIAAGAYAATISVKQIESTWDALSHFPDRRARLELQELGSRLNYFAGRLDTLKAEGGAIEIEAEAERFARRHVELTRRAWAMESRCLSWFIVGPANFPTRTNEKRQASRDKAYSLVSGHTAAACKAIERHAFPHGRPGDAIRSNNPDAPSLIRAKIEKCRQRHALMKLANEVIRSTKGQEVAARIEALRGATGLHAATCAKLVCPPEAWMGQGFEGYQLSGELAEIKRLEGRLQQIEAVRERGTTSTEHETKAGKVEVIENAEAARIQLVFPGKPDADTRAALKSHGFRWAPSEGAWQRHLNNSGRYAVQCVLKQIAA